MKKLSLFICTIILIFQAKAQLNVTGQASISVKPDRAIISYSINESKDSYNEAIDAMTNRIDELTQSLMKIGFKKEEIKTSNFNIRQNRKYRQGEHVGEEFIASQSLEVKFVHSNKRLLEVLNFTTSAKSTPNVSIAFDLSDDERDKVRAQLIRKAVADARGKADILAAETGYQIKGVKEINYGANTSQPRPIPGNMGIMRTLDKSDLSNFEAKDLTLNEQVFISYEIAN